MINLLPTSEKQKLKEEQLFKEIVILSIVTLAGLCVLSCLLFLVKMDLENKLSLQKISLENERKEFESSGAKKLEKEGSDLNKIISRLESFYSAKSSMSDIVEKIGATVPQGIRIDNLSFEKQTSQIYISGLASTREVLLGFKQSLEKEATFSSVYFPSSNWTSPLNISFSITIKIE